MRWTPPSRRRGPRGPGRLAYPKVCIGHAKVAAYIRAIVSAASDGGVATTWDLVVSALGEGKAVALGPKKARHLCERTLSEAESAGLIRRAPCLVKSHAPVDVVRKPQYLHGGPKRVKTPLSMAWTTTADGLEFLRRYDRELAREEGTLETRPSYRASHYAMYERKRRRREARNYPLLGYPELRGAAIPVIRPDKWKGLEPKRYRRPHTDQSGVPSEGMQ